MFGKGSEKEEISLETYEVLVYSGQQVKALNLMLKFLKNHREFSLIRKVNESEGDYQRRLGVSLDRFVAATIALLLNNKWQLSEENFEKLIQYKHQLLKTIATSDYDSTDHFFSAASQIKYSSKKDRLMRLQLLLSIDTNPELLTLILSEKGISPTTLVWLAGELTLKSGFQEELREQIIQLLTVISKDVKISKRLLLHVAYPWMNCSYLISDRRHQIKLSLNQMIRNRFKTNYLTEQVSEKVKDKPKMLVMHEIFKKGHAMFRCYKQVMVSLAEKFELVFVGRKSAIDDEALTFCDKFIEVRQEVEKKGEYGKFATELAKEKPDVVYYPSIGMNSWSVVLSNFRIAPVQCMSLGHPATSASPEIDFAVSGSFKDPHCFTEKLVVPKDLNGVYERPEFELSTAFDEDEFFHVAVVSSHMKINSFFLEVCKYIRDNSSKTVKYHFFPNASGIFYHYVIKMIEKELPGSIIHEPKPYNEFMNEISQCKVRLGAVPFGGTNTNIDCIALGIPFVVLDGAEAFSHHDVLMLELSGISEGLVAQSIEDYAQKAIRLIDEDDFRMQKSKDMKKSFDSGVLFDADNDGGTNGDTFWWIYQNAEKMLASEQQLFIEGDDIKLPVAQEVCHK